MIEVIDKKDYTQITNEMRLEFAAVSDNESFARMAVAAFIAPLNPTLEELSDVKTAVSEAVTNAIIHGYGNRGCITEHVLMNCELKGDVLEVEVIDRGVGIEDVDRAMQPLFTTRPEWERSGMGFAFMEAFMDDLEVLSEPGQGTLVRMYKKIGLGSWIGSEE
ncbi:MAG: anti-sigma F factor [Lachnospiraceae bacterium]|nr:anti-sigma F factor [Lachnospiraceae bacterium]